MSPTNQYEGESLDGGNAARVAQFKRNLNRIMIARRMNQAELSRATKIGKDSISKYCSGRRLPSLEYLAEIALALQVKPGELTPSELDTMYEGPKLAAARQEAGASPAMEFIPGEVARARVRLDTVVNATTAIEIMRLLASDESETVNDNDVADRS